MYTRYIEFGSMHSQEYNFCVYIIICTHSFTDMLLFMEYSYEGNIGLMSSILLDDTACVAAGIA